MNKKVFEMEDRTKYIGGSDIAAILGLNPYMSAYKVWSEKTGRAQPRPTNESMEWGNRLEAVIADHYAEVMGVKVRRRRALRQHPDYPFLGGHLDRFVVGQRIGLECKLTTVAQDWGEPWTDQVPLYPLCQAAHYMEVFDFDEWHVAVLIASRGFKFQIHKIRRGKLGEIAIEAGVDFWRNHIETDTPPDPQTESDIRSHFAKSTPSAIQATTEVRDWEKARRELKGRGKSLNESAEELKLKIMSFMGENELLKIGDQTLISWKTNKRNQRVFREVAHDTEL